MGFFTEIDNACSEEDAKKIYDILIGYKNETTWRFVETVLQPFALVEMPENYNRPSVNMWRKELSKAGWSNNFQMVAPFIKDDESLNQVLIPNFYKALEISGLKLVQIMRSKANLLFKTNNNEVNEPHIDADMKHYVFLYYVNDSDGDTLLYEESYPSRPTEFTLKNSVTPKMGKAIIFDGHTYHSSTNPIKTDYRCVINMDFIAEIIKE